MSVESEVPQPPWLQPARRSEPRTPLTRDAIVDATLRVLDREGLDGVTMRRVAEELETSPGSLYWHVRNKEELLGLAFDRVVGEIELPPPDPARWEQQLKDAAREARRAFTRHRDIARFSLGRIPLGPSMLVLNEWTLGLLREAGVPDRVAAYAGDLFGLYVGAHAFEESLGLQSPTGEDLPPDEVLGMIRGYFASLPPARFPNTLAVLDDLVEGGPDERFELGLDVIIGGIAAQRAST